MTDVGFIRPEMLWGLLIIVPLVFAWTFYGRIRESRLARFIVRDNWGLLNRSVSTRGRFHKGVLLLLALSLSIVAAARPYWGTRERDVSTRGVSIIFAMDVSKSMLAADVTPNRLDYAKTLVRQILTSITGNRVGIMPFAGEAFLQCPLTTDYGVVMDTLRATSFNAIGYEGTNIPAVIDEAIGAFDRSGAGKRVLVILTDGEDFSDAITEAADRAAAKNMVVYAIGVGTREGAPIRLPDGSFKEARDGTKVLTRMNEQILQSLAERTGGAAFVAADSGRLDPAPIIAALRAIEAEELAQEKRVVREERYQWPLALALLCLVIEGLIGERRRAPKTPAPTLHRNRRRTEATI